MTTQELIKEASKYIQKYAPKYGIKVYSPILGQMLLESSRGTSELAVNANNYFGLKYKKGRCPTAIGIYHKVGSEQNADGTYTSSAMQWCKFKNLEDCIVGYFDFINISRYSNLKGITDPKDYLEKIKADGYATSIKYVENVYNVIQSYNLTQYDNIGGNTMKYKVAVDAGHGSNTAGKRTPDGYREHWCNVKCANYFDIALKRCGFESVKIAWDDTNAKDDTDVALGTRQAQIKKEKCDASVSWHANAFGNGKSYNSSQGIETLIHSDSAKAKDSKELATKVQNNLIKGTKQKNRDVKLANLAMCNCVAMGTKASILIEVGFMTNEYEANLIQSDAFCQECAEEAAQGVCEYFGVTYVKPNNQSSTSNSSATIPNSPNSTTYTKIQFIKDIQSAIGAKVDGIAGKETLSKTVTVSKTKNNRHAVIKPIQKYLNTLGFSCGIADGIAGAKFDVAVKAYQKANGCVVDGEITAQKITWKKLLGM